MQRIYTDFDHFDDEGGLLYGKEFVNAIKWLYDEEYFEGVNGYEYECYMRPRLPLYDFMSLVTAFVCNAFEEFAKEKTTSCIDALEEGSGGYRFEGQGPEYTYKEDIITIRKMERETTGVVLWASYIYCHVRSEWGKNRSKFHEAADMFFKLFRRKIPLNDEALKKHILMKHKDETMRTFVANILSSPSNATPPQQKKAASSEAEEDRLNALNQQVKTLQAKNQQLEEELTAYKEKEKGIDQHLTALFGLKLAELLGITYTNKQKALAPVLSKLFGWGKRRIEQELCTFFSNEDELELANIFGKLSPDIAKKICLNWQDNNSSENANSEE